MDCCKHKKSAKKCMRKSDKKIFSLPRRFTRKRCKKGAKGFTMKSSCAPYNGCKKGGSKINKTKKGQKGAGGNQSKIVSDSIDDERSFLHDFLTEGHSWRAKYIQKHNYDDEDILIWFAVESRYSAEYCRKKHDIACMNRHKTNEKIARRILFDRRVIPEMYIHLYHPALGNEHLLDPDSQEYKDYYEKLKEVQEGVKEYWLKNAKDDPIDIVIDKTRQSPPKKVKTPPRGSTSKKDYTPTTDKLEKGTLNTLNKKISPIKLPSTGSEEIQNKKIFPFPPMGPEEV